MAARLEVVSARALVVSGIGGRSWDGGGEVAVGRMGRGVAERDWSVRRMRERGWECSWRRGESEVMSVVESVFDGMPA